MSGKIFLGWLIFCSLLGTLARADTALTGDGRVISNPTSNGDLKLRVNVGGTPTDVLNIQGSTGSSILGLTGQSNYQGARIAGATDGVAMTNSAMDGYVGEVFETGSITNITTTEQTVVAISSMPPGVYALYGGVKTNDSGSATGLNCCLSSNASACDSNFALDVNESTCIGTRCGITVGPRVVSFSSATTYRLVCVSRVANFVSVNSNMIRAIRMR